MTCAPCARRDKPALLSPPALTAKRLWVGHMSSICRTGDVILFSSKHRTSEITKYFTNSAWDHVAIVVKSTPSRAYLVEWSKGLFASELCERLTEYAELDARRIVLRQLHLGVARRAECERQMELVIDRLFRSSAGRNASVPLGQVLRAARKQYFGRSGTSIDDGAKIDDLSMLFCSKTVAVVYKAAEILAQNRIAADFLPKHFGEDYDSWLDLQGGAFLGPETHVTFESPGLRAAVHAMSGLVRSPFTRLDSLVHSSLELAGISVPNTDQRDKAARLVQKFVLILLARRELSRRRELVQQQEQRALEHATPCQEADDSMTLAELLGSEEVEPTEETSEARGVSHFGHYPSPKNGAAATRTDPTSSPSRVVPATPLSAARSTAAERNARLRQLAEGEMTLWR